MCGRFGIYAESSEYNNQLGFSIRNGLFDFQPNYNATPSQMLPALYRPDDDDPLLETLHWGLIPHWAKDPKISHKLFNARAETAHEKPSFREAYIKRRALIPANGWYEWLRQDGVKQPYFHAASDNKLLWLAGLWEHWEESSTQQTIRSFTLLTQEAYGKAAIIHNRMPVIMHSDDYLRWLSPELKNKREIGELIHSQPEQALHIYPVTTAMNKPQFNDNRCIQPI